MQPSGLTVSFIFFLFFPLNFLTSAHFLSNMFKWYRGDDDEREYLVKWKELPYDECYWEFESDISAFQPEIERFNRLRSRSSKFSSGKQKNSVKDDAELKKQQKEFQHYEQSPEFLSGGMLL